MISEFIADSIQGAKGEKGDKGDTGGVAFFDGGGYYYAYVTATSTINAWRTKDMTNWQYLGAVFRPDLGGSLEENALYNVTLTYDNAGTAVTKILTVRIIPAGEVIVNARNEETYPNSDYIDLTSLFAITDGGASVPVTPFPPRRSRLRRSRGCRLSARSRTRTARTRRR